MKKNRNLTGYVPAVLIAAALFVSACKKDRIPQDDYQDMDSFYNDNKEEEQEYTIDSLGNNCWLTCLKGTRICTTADMQELPGNAPVYYPYKLKVVELYSAKDMILWRAPSVTSSGVLETSAEIRVRLFKDGTETALKGGRYYGLETANLTTIQSNMLPHYGFTNGDNINWSASLASIYPGFTDTTSLVTPTPAYYAAQVSHTGFFSPARTAPATGNPTTVTFTVAGTNTQNIQLFLVFSGFKGIIRASNLVASQVPEGESVSMIAFAKKQDGNYYMDQQTFTVTPGMTLPLNMTQTTDAGILSALAAL